MKGGILHERSPKMNQLLSVALLNSASRRERALLAASGAKCRSWGMSGDWLSMRGGFSISNFTPTSNSGSPL